MAAHLEEATGKAAGRVTITSTLTSLVPPFFAVLVVVACALLDILSAEMAGAVVLGILATAGLTTGTVFATAKNTPTDQTKVVYSSGGYDQVVPEVASVAVAPASTTTAGSVSVGSTALDAEDPLETSSDDAAARMRAELQGGCLLSTVKRYVMVPIRGAGRIVAWIRR